jgi:hypothetical protein
MFSPLPSKEQASSISSAVANSTGARGVSYPAPTSQGANNPPIQFTLEDAQRKWAQWYKSADVDEEKIRQYIAAKKRGWGILKKELNKAPADAELMDTDAGEIDHNAMQVDEQPKFTIHSDDQETIEHITGKQYTAVSDSTQKLETDIRKFNAAALRSGRAREGNHHQLGMPLDTFFRKNAPPGYNTSLQDEEEETQEYQYDVQYERDFTFGLSEDPINSRREKSDYFRAPFAHKHVVRDEHEKALRRDLIKHYPQKSKKIGGKQVYMSFEVVQAAGNKLQIKNWESSYSNNNMLGSRSGKTVVQRKIFVAGHPLILWVNEDSAGHQSRYNASAIVPNLVQHQEITTVLKINNTVDVDPSVNIDEKSFRSDTRKAILGQEPQALPTANYKQELLNDRRQLVTNVSNTINAQVKNNYMRAITSATQQDFLQYPCLVLQPLPNFAPELAGRETDMMDELKKKIVFTFHDQYAISFANRASFGFAYPTVGDVGPSVRIWPGLIPAQTFSYMMLEVLKEAGLLKDFENKFTGKKEDSAPLVLALKLAVIRAQKRFRRYQDIKAAKTGDLVEKDTYKWVNDRITSNVIKAEVLVKELAKDPGNLDIIKRSIRTLENLNEYELIQAGVEEQQSEAPEKERKETLSAAFKQRSANRTVQHYELVSETIRNSGMDAYRTAIQTIGHIHTDSSRLYFETAKVNKAIAGAHGIVRSGSVTKMQDPSYNFISQKDLASKPPYTWSRNKHYPGVHIYDITNTPIDAAIAKALPTAPSVIVLFESLSKHFQFGMDKTTIGRLIVYVRASRKNRDDVKALTSKFEQLKDSQLPNYFLNYMAMQNELFGE